MTKSLSEVAWSPEQRSREEQEGWVSYRLMGTFLGMMDVVLLDLGNGGPPMSRVNRVYPEIMCDLFYVDYI